MRLFDGHEFYDPTVTLGEARDYIESKCDDGVRCPCCTQFVKVYHRNLNAGMAASLIALWRKAGADMVHLNSTVSHISHEAAQLSWWGMIVQDDTRRQDGGRASWWRVTDLGNSFLHNHVMVSKYVYVFDGNVLGYDDRERISIVDALGDKFDYRKLMES
jgi:hypothetical protein